ncbi:MAG: hypothetical protein AAF340_16595 [Pseudomonadota bacterium]
MLTPVIGATKDVEQGSDRTPIVERFGILACFITLCVLAFTRNVNWDEFHFLSFVHAWLDGRLDRPMQTGFVYAFGWLKGLPGHEIDQIIAARLVMVGCVALTALSVHRIARHFTNQRYASFAVLAFLCSGFVLAHGGSFRSDPIAAALLTSALALSMTTKLSAWQVFAISLLTALAFLVTIKSALYLPCFLGVLIWRAGDRAALMKLTIALVLAGVSFWILYGLHAAGLVIAEGKDTATTASSAVKTTLLSDRFFPRADTILSWALFSLPQLALAAIAIYLSGKSRLTVVVLLFCAPLLCVVIYRNAYVYFFPFAAPLLMVAVAVAAQKLATVKMLERFGLAMLAAAAVQLVLIAPENARTQRATLTEIHRLFDQPVPYIDGYGMVASFQNTSFFTSSWGVAKYRAKGVPVFVDIIETQQPPLLIAHRRPLGAAMVEETYRDDDLDLLLADRTTLRASYIHYSGSIWLAGIEVENAGAAQRARLPFPGRYRLEADVNVRINATTLAPGESINLEARDIFVEGPAGTKLRLIWDTGVEPISRDALGRDMFVGFKRLVL